MGDAPKLDWMYAGAAGHVDAEEYLTGRAVDKTFEQFKLGGAEPIGLDLPAPTLPRNKSVIPNYQVDVARKVQEDPLLRIRRQEEERRATLREQMQIQQRLAIGSKKVPLKQADGDHKRRKEKDDSESSDSNLDSKLKNKLKKLKQNKEEDIDKKIARKLKKLKKKRRSSSSSSSSEREQGVHKKYVKESSSRHRDEDRHVQRRPDSTNNSRREYSTSSSRAHDVRKRSRSREDRREVRNSRSPGREAKSRTNLPVNHQRRTESKFTTNKTTKLSEKDLEQRRKEMMQHAVLRDQERKDKVDKYRKEIEDEAGELNSNRPKEAAFVKKQLATATANTTVEARIKANVFNIQRSVNSMDSNFARR